MSEDLTKLKFKRRQQKAAVTRIQRFIQSLNSDAIDTKTLFEIKARLIKLNSVNTKFDEIQTNIEILVDGDASQLNLEEEQRVEFEETYYKLLSEIQEIISNAESSISEKSQNDPIEKQRIKLPTIDLPTFDGSYQNWVPFRDTFKSLIHDQECLTKIEKFHYLRASLKGEASSILDTLKVCEDNYEIAFENLIARYENKKLLIHNHIKSIFECSNVQKDSVSGLRKLIDELKGNVATLQNLGIDVTNWDPLLLYWVTTKLDESTRREWEAKTCAKESPSLKEFYEFINHRCLLLEKLSAQKQNNQMKVISKPPSKNPYLCQPKSAAVKTFVSSNENKICPHCSQQHMIFNCSNFLELPVNSRHQIVKTLKICFNCLKPNHNSKVCVAGGCKKCGHKHNTLLHLDPTVSQPQNSSTGTKSPTSILSAYALNNTEVLLSTALVIIHDNKGIQHLARALLDSGSQSNFLSKELSDKLKMPSNKIQQPVKGINQMSLEITNVTDLEIQSRTTRYRMKSSFLIIDKITNELPQNPINVKALKIPENITLADPTFGNPGKIDMLIGAPLFWELLGYGQIKLNIGQLIMQKTKLGWIISGSIPLNQNLSKRGLQCHFLTLDEQLERFWNLENVTEQNSNLVESEFETNFQNTLKRRSDGKFEVGLPFKSNIHQLGDSLKNAQRRFFLLERRLNKSQQMKEKYIKFMEEYESLGHMSEITEEAPQTKHIYYLPHHGIFKEDSITTKLRVVFDGSAKTDTGLSLNDVLMNGSQLQDELFSILLRFRKHSIVITSDVEKMYRQVYIRPPDRDLQRILWRKTSDEPLKTYRLNTVTYGTKSGSFLAIRCLQEIANKIESAYPHLSKIIKHDFYVDDLLTGGETVNEVLQLRQLLSSNLSEFGFNLRKWNSNHASVLEKIKQNNSELKHLIIEDNITKTLGLLWDARKDTIQFSVQNNFKPGYTKRLVISAIAQIFDPLGLIGPVTTTAKILMQDLWKYQLDWDESIPDEAIARWKIFQENWSFIKQLEIPRHVLIENSVQIDIHGFCDASESAYGACIYLHSVNKTGEQMIRLLCSKARVAPLRTITLPRLELCGALLLSKLVKKVINSIQIKPNKVFLWTDSRIVLAWLAKDPSNWKTFVSNRVSEIQTITKEFEWSHINGKENPADIISRGMSASLIIKSELWWNGPSWLKLPVRDWPLSTNNKEPLDVPDCKKKSKITTCTIVIENDIFNKYSTFNKLQRIVALLRRFCHNSRKDSKKRTGFIDRQELEEALITIVRRVQTDVFRKEIGVIESNKSIPNKSRLLSLNPIVDKQGILRVGGRIKNSDLDYESKHQMILPQSHKITELIIKNEHHKQLHAGTQSLLCSLRLRFWIIGARNAIKKTLRKCITCIKTKPKFFDHQMGELPEDRVTPSYPFQVCGVDYGGPIETKSSNLRKAKIIKSYICIFVCFSTKATHIELAVDLTSEAFINAFKRFISRRGKPSRIYSDNGRNFLGAKNIFSELEKTAQFVSKEKIQWKFIPARSPHFGGLWEAAIKSTKFHLKRVIGTTILTYEELCTLLTQIEACLNSRPLTPISSDPDDLSPLTPAHFLIGRHFSTIPEPNLQSIPESRLNRYQMLTRMTQNFWSRWSREYLTNLQQRSKWKVNPKTLPKEGDVVLIKDECLQPLQWRLGRIVKTHPGADGTTRVVDLKISSGIITRSIKQLCPLPLD